MGVGGGGGSQAAGFQIGSYWSPGGVPVGYKYAQNTAAAATGVYINMLLPTGAAYQVSSGKTFTVTQVICTWPSILYNAILGYSDDGAGTNFVALLPLGGMGAATAISIVMTIPATKYPTLKGGSYGTAAGSGTAIQGIES